MSPEVSADDAEELAKAAAEKSVIDAALSALDELFGPDSEIGDGSPSKPQSDLDITGGDLTFGEDLQLDEMSLHGLQQELAQFKGQEVVSTVLGQGPDLRDFSRDVEEKLRAVELESIQDYILESDTLLTLHSQIKECDVVLSHMETLLGGFQADLGSVSSEIKGLQEKSMAMGVKLRNRKAAETKLARFVEEMVLPPDLIKALVDDPVSESYVRNLQLLNRKLHFVAEDSLARTSAAMADIQPELEKLKRKSILKAREYLMQKIYALRKPKTNIHILQHNVLLKYKYLAIFLKEHGRVVYTEVEHAYTDIMNKVLSLHLRTYVSSLEKLQLDIATKADLIGVADDAPKGSSSVASAVPASLGAVFSGVRAQHRDIKNRSSVFSLGTRASVLEDPEQPAIIPHIAEASASRFPYDVLFRSLHKLLMDTATSEFLFCTDFFGDESTFQAVFAGPMSAMDVHLQSVLPHCFDAIGLMLMIRMTKQHQDIMVERRVTCLDAYFDKVNMLIWPRFKLVMDMHLQSVKGANPRALWEDDVHPHYVTRRYAEFAASLMLLNTNYGDGQLELNLDRLRVAVDHLLVEISRLFPRQKQRTVFLINNYNLVLTVLKETGVDQGRTQQQFSELLSSFTTVFVEEELREHFGPLVDFVRKKAGMSDDSRSASSSPSKPSPPLTVSDLEPHVKEFAGRWKTTIESIHKDVITNFSSFVCGMDILRAVLTQLLLYYTRLTDCIKKVEAGGALMKEVVSIQSIMYEIRKYSLTF